MRFRRDSQAVSVHTLAGAYTMDAVSQAERARFERHLAGCDACRQEVRGLREATAALGAAAAVRPPDALRDKVLRTAAQTRQVPPALSEVPAPRARDRRRLGWRPRITVAVGGALAAVGVAVAAGVVTYGMQNRLDQAQGRDLTVAAVLTASDARMMSAPVSTGGTATVVMSHREHALVFTAAHLRSLPAAERYELWLIGPAGARPAGMITASGRGRMVGPMVVSGLSAGERIGITVEPAAGSPRPTSPPVVMLSLAGGSR
ncbi:MAG TPA: anti-sigma factor [Streptosporangiaceae bacterium]|nr:anti-sigma factor [Streptosporangiaceae bacterium]